MESLIPPIAQRATETDRQVAVRDEEGTYWTYGQLWMASTQRLHQLEREGVGPGDRVTLAQPKRKETLALILAILRRNAVVVPLDPQWPRTRMEKILADCRPVLHVGTEWEKFGPSPKAPAGAAYLLYTSGSTGDPKGVLHTHGSMGEFLRWCEVELQPNKEDVFLSQAGLHFDLSVLDLFLPLRHGASVALLTEQTAGHPRRILEAIATLQPTVWYSTPTILNRLVEHGQPQAQQLHSLRTVLFAGEPFPSLALQNFRQTVPQAQLYNFYGPTESNVCTAYRLPPFPAPLPSPCPIGRAIGNFETRTDEQGQLWVRGPGRMWGYWGETKLDPQSWYPTRDRVTLGDEGDWVFVERLDRMFKRQGVRMEPAEIENALLQHPAIAEVVVLSIRTEIVAFYGGRVRLGQLDLKKHCADRLPRAFIPQRFVHWEKLPTTSTHKIDLASLTRSLSHPTSGQETPQEQNAPRSPQQDPQRQG